MTERRGRFIVLEGGEGAGKSTVAAALAERIAAEGRRVVVTREPGGTQLGESLRSLILDRTSPVDPVTELLLFEAARAQLVAEVIRPALDRHDVVVCDRFSASSVAYQGFGRQLGREFVEQANATATRGLTPDMTLLLDLSVEAGLQRRGGAGAMNHFDKEDLAFHERVREGFLELAREFPGSWRVLDATAGVPQIVDAAYAAVRPLLQHEP
jgi:dTMP kinase